ncbi:unnamed protein product, partial [Iphiclides podalirius]
MYVMRDLVVDMTHFFKGYNSIRPYLVRKNHGPMGQYQHAQSVKDSLKMVGPASLLHAYRWVIDSRDDDTQRRLEELRDDFKAFRCHTIMNCSLDCPKNLHPAEAIAKLKLLISGMAKKPTPELDPMKLASTSDWTAKCKPK